MTVLTDVAAADSPVAAKRVPPCRTDVTFVDAITGREVVGCEPIDAPKCDDIHDIKLPSPRFDWVRAGTERDGGIWRPIPGTQAYRVPAPYFVWPEPAPSATLSDRTKSFRFTQPLHRELDIRLRLFERDGSLGAASSLSKWSFDGWTSDGVHVEPIDGESIRLRRVPWLPGRSLTLYFCPADEALFDSAAGVESEHVADASGHTRWTTTWKTPVTHRFKWTIEVPAWSVDPIVSDVVLDWTTVPAHTDVGGGGSGCFGRGIGCPGRPRDCLRGDARVRFTDSVGRPLARARVSIATLPALTDDDGVARVTGAREGIGCVCVPEAGCRFEHVPITIVAGREVSFDLAEAPANTLEIHVVDSNGRPFPSATIEIRPARFDWFDVDWYGVQRLDPFTDQFGCRTCRDVPCGTVTVRARFAGRIGESEVVVSSGTPSVVRVVLD